MIKDVSAPEFFPKVERKDTRSNSANSTSAKSKESNSSELLESNFKESSKSPKSFKEALNTSRADRRDQKASRSEDKAQVRNDIKDGSQSDENQSLDDKITRRSLNPNSKKELESKVKESNDFVMPGMLPGKFSVPKRGVDESLAANEQLSGLADQQILLKQEAVSEFVSEMQNQFGITPEQILAAFSQLNPQVLSAPASESTKAFVDQLPLAGDQKSQAAALYSQMLEQTGDSVFGEQMMGTPNASVSTEVMNKKEYNQQLLDKSLRELNQQFFRNGKIETQQDQTAKVSIEGMNAVTGAAAFAEAQTASISKSGDQSQNSSAKSEKSSSISPADFFASGMTSALAAGGEASANGGGSDWSQQQQNQNQNAQAANVKVQPQFMAAGAFTPEIAKANSAATTKAEGAEGKALKGDELLNALNSTLSQGLTSTKLAEGAIGSTEMLQGQLTPSADEKAANIQQLIKQAQVIIKQGGGEMKLEMSPEGMGQVNLKVAVENGQVSIQMVAHKNETKKMIEEGLSDLKASLAAHKLQVDNLKVDLSDSVSKQMQEQLKDHQQSQAREFAQNFLGNMRDERQGFRQGFFDNSSGMRQYKKHSEREDGVPQPGSSVAAAKKKQADRRLDMVA